MLIYKLVGRLKHSIIYDIYPEGNENVSARIEFMDDGTVHIIKELPSEYNRMYIGQAIHGIDKNKDSGACVWF